MTELIGAIAAILTTLSFVPQAVMTVRTGQTDGISLTMYLLFTIGVTFWLVYGLMIASLPIILANAITVSLAMMILATKARSVLRTRAR
jgi:MtN3 and saliva related transmembrane protein